MPPAPIDPVHCCHYLRRPFMVEAVEQCTLRDRRRHEILRDDIGLAVPPLLTVGSQISLNLVKPNGSIQARSFRKAIAAMGSFAERRLSQLHSRNPRGSFRPRCGQFATRLIGRHASRPNSTPAHRTSRLPSRSRVSPGSKVFGERPGRIAATTVFARVGGEQSYATSGLLAPALEQSGSGNLGDVLLDSGHFPSTRRTSRTPGPPPFCEMNSIPAVSSALANASSVVCLGTV